MRRRLDAHPFKSAAARDAYLAFYERRLRMARAVGDTDVRDRGRRHFRARERARRRTASGAAAAAERPRRAGYRWSRPWRATSHLRGRRHLRRRAQRECTPIKTTDDAMDGSTGCSTSSGSRTNQPDGHLLRRMARIGVPASPPERLAKVAWLSPAGVVLPMSGEFLARSMVCLFVGARLSLGDALDHGGRGASGPELFEDAIEEMRFPRSASSSACGRAGGRGSSPTMSWPASRSGLYVVGRTNGSATRRPPRSPRTRWRLGSSP